MTLSAPEQKRVQRMVADMRPYRSILAEFPEAHAVAVRDFMVSLFMPPPAPIDMALAVLGPRAAERKMNGPGWRLDGRPVTARELIVAANQVRACYGQEPIKYPGVTG